MKTPSLTRIATLLTFSCLVSLSLMYSPNAEAKDLTNRLGIGYSNQFSTDLPSIAARYYPSQDIAISGALGLYTGTANSKFGFMAKVHRVVFPEDNMNFYMGAGAGLLSNKVTANNTNESGFELLGFAGAEFFFTGLDSLGFSFEAGVGIVSVSSGVTFRTIGDSPFKANVIFYF